MWGKLSENMIVVKIPFNRLFLVYGMTDESVV